MLNRALLNKTIRQIPDLKELISCTRVYEDHYRSRVPFITIDKLTDISLLLKFCIGDYHDLCDMSKYRGYLRKASNLYLRGVCTDRSNTLDASTVEYMVNDLRSSDYGTQITLVNVTNRSHYPVILEYIRAQNLEVITRTTTQIGGKPVEFVGVRKIYTPQNCSYVDSAVEKYTIFTTLWDYDVNLSLVYTALNHMLTNPVAYESAEWNRPVKSRRGFAWFRKYFNGTDVTPLIIEYFNEEFIKNLEAIKIEAITKSLNAFSKTKVAMDDNIDKLIRRHRNDIKTYESHIAAAYEEIRKITMQKLTEADKADLLETAIKIFKGMLAKGTLVDFNYSVYSDTNLEAFSWCVRLPITYWEADEAKYWLNTYKADSYKHDLFKAMFMDGLVTSWCEQYMTINLASGGRVSNSCGLGDTSTAIYPPNPHVGRYNCFGNNANEVMRAIANKDVATAITICMNACMQLNMTDHTVTSHWMDECVPQHTNYDHMAFLEYRGNLYTPSQLYALYTAEGGFSNGKETEVNQQAEEADA